jgi:hypothetical protein
MNLRLILAVITISLACSALFAREPDPKLLKIIEKECDLDNPKISLDDKVDCVTDYTNCAIVGAGETDLNKLTRECVGRKSRERVHEQLQD